MQTQDLEIYQQLYELRSINLVARTMGFAQSNITVRLQVLEAEFGTQLFTRSAQGLTPTANGTRFYHYAQSVLRATTKIKAQMEPVQAGQTVAISELLFNYLVVASGRLALADSHFAIVGSTALLQETPDVDTVITYANFNDPRYTEVARDYLPASFLVRDAAKAAELPLLVNQDRACPFRARTLRLAQGKRQVLEIDSWASIIELVKAGRGVALLPQYLAAAEHLTVVDAKRHFRVPYGWFRR